MSAYDSVPCKKNVVDKAILMEALGLIIGKIEDAGKVSITNVWNHVEKVDIGIPESQLPPECQGFGDLGLVQGKDGKFSFRGLQTREAWMIDNAKGREKGTTSAAMARFQEDVENCYECISIIKATKARFPNLKISKPSRITAGEGASATTWGARVVGSKSELLKAKARTKAMA